MSITIDEMNTEVIAEPASQLAGAAAAPTPQRLDDIALMRFTLAQSVRLQQRLAAEGFDD